MMALSTRNKTRLIEKVHEEMEEHYPLYDRETMEQAARTYLDCVDKEGFVFDFDQAWQWAGYAKKRNAKDKLTGRRGKLNLQEGVDYKIETPKRTNGKHGGQNKEKIMLTYDALQKFLLSCSSSKPISFFLQAVWNEANLFAKKDTNARKRRLEIVDETIIMSRDLKRKKREHDEVCYILARNEDGLLEYNTEVGIVDVLTKNEAIEVKPSHDWKHGLGQALAYATHLYRKPRLHLFGERLEYQKERIITTNGCRLTYHCNQVQIHSDVAAKAMENIKDDVQGPISDGPLNLVNARKTVALEDKPQEEINTLDNYFR